MNIAKVALPIKLYSTFDYVIPSEMSEIAKIGYRVNVPFGHRTLNGLIVEISQESNYPVEKLKPINRVLDHSEIFTPDLWKLLLWAVRYYHHPIGEVLFHAMPILLRQGRSQYPNSEKIWTLTPLGEKTEPNELKRAVKQRALLNQIRSHQLTEEFPTSIYRALEDKGLIEQVELKNNLTCWNEQYQSQTSKVTMNEEQSFAVNAIKAKNHFSVFLLNGVTGSGKTEVYLTAIDAVLAEGRQALVLVPEIGLTPQTIERFQSRFNVPIEIWHSNLTDKARLTVWQKMKSNKSAIIVGTRSAIFTPFDNLGIIVVDEEHDTSYKQQEGWRYHARDLATMRAKLNNVPIILGSATPSFESLRNVELGRYLPLHLTQRAGEAKPVRQHILDIKGLPLTAGISKPMLERMQLHLSQNNQVLLFLNRRGFSPILMCHECGWIAECPRCDKPFTYHHKQDRLICHHCDSHRPIPKQCIQCGSTHLIPIGVGTEQVEAALKASFPTIPITRIDRDSTSKRGSLDLYLDQIQKGGAHILVGTQILAKGHHFPDVTLVGILDVDGVLFSSDFRAPEHFAQLYTQVSGRAGRAHKKGEVILQTHYPEHPLLHSLLEQGYERFAEQGLKERAIAMLPPFSYQIIIRAADKNNRNAQHFLEKVKLALLQIVDPEQIWLLGPLPSLYAKKAGFHYWQLILQSDNRAELNQLLAPRLAEIDSWPESKRVKWSVDVDPIEN